MGKRQERIENFADDLWQVTPDFRWGYTPKRKVFEAMTRLNGWRPQDCDNYYSDAVLWLIADDRYIKIKTGRGGGIAKSRNPEDGKPRWQHTIKVMVGQRRRVNKYGHCLFEAGVEGIVEIGLTEQPLLPAPQSEAKT